MAKTFSTLCALGLSAVAAFAQQPGSRAAVLPPAAGGGSPVPAAPAPFDPPVVPTEVQQTIPPAPGTPDAAIVVPVTGAPPVSRVHEFQGDEIGLVLRTLARQAKMNISVSEKVTTTAGVVNLRVEDKSPREAIEIIVLSKGLVMDNVNDVYYIKTPEERAKEPAESHSYTFSYAQAKDIQPLLEKQLQSGMPSQFDARTNTIFYREGKSNIDKVKLFLVSVDKPTQQVMIEARLVEVTSNPNQAYGINWGGVVGGNTTPQTFRYGGSGSVDVGGPANAVIYDEKTGALKGNDFFLNGQTTGGFLNALAGQFAILSIPQMSATLRLLNEDSDANFLANPRVVTANNQKAEIKITRNQPVPQLNFNEQTAQAVFSGFQDKEYGNTLNVTPSINKDDFVTLLVKPEISNKVGDATFTFSGATVTSPVIDKRTLESNVLIRSGDTLAIGGLLQDETVKARAKVPGLGDLPVLGYLFQEHRNSRTKRNLLVFVTPTVIKQGYGTGLEDQVSGLSHSGEEYADPNGWRNNARGALRIVPTSNRTPAADIPKPGVAKAPRKTTYKVSTSSK